MCTFLRSRNENQAKVASSLKRRLTADDSGDAHDYDGVDQVRRVIRHQETDSMSVMSQGCLDGRPPSLHLRETVSALLVTADPHKDLTLQRDLHPPLSPNHTRSG